jgi:hypothetical protein
MDFKAIQLMSMKFKGHIIGFTNLREVKSRGQNKAHQIIKKGLYMALKHPACAKTTVPFLQKIYMIPKKLCMHSYDILFPLND